MRVSDINYDVGDNLFIYALIISSEKTINQKKTFIFQSHSRWHDKQNQSKIEKPKKLPNLFLAVFLVGNLLIQTVSHNRLSQ